jgi:hypothetical protein
LARRDPPRPRDGGSTHERDDWRYAYGKKRVTIAFNMDKTIHQVAEKIFTKQGQLSARDLREFLRTAVEHELQDLRAWVNQQNADTTNATPGENIAWRTAVVTIKNEIDRRLQEYRDEHLDYLRRRIEPPTT